MAYLENLETPHPNYPRTLLNESINVLNRVLGEEVVGATIGKVFRGEELADFEKAITNALCIGEKPKSTEDASF